MKKLFLTLLLLCSALLSAQDGLTGSASYYRTNEPRYEHRVNVVPSVRLGRVFYLGDFILNEGLGDPWINKRQFKNMVGVNVLGGFYVRYQNDDYYNEILTKGKIKVKSFNEDRYGIGYRRTDRIGGVQIMNDLMYLNSNIADRRSEWNIHINAGNVQIKHQLWYDYLNGHSSNWYEKLIVGYKFTPSLSLQWRSEWKPTVKRVDMVGVGVQF